MAKKNKLENQLKAGIEEYTGGVVESMKTYTCSVGSVAIRVVVNKHSSQETFEIDFLVIAQDVERCKTAAAQVIAYECLEEAEYETWPPKEGPARFF